MSWGRWWATVIIATLGAVVISIAAGDFDPNKRATQKQAAIEQARRASGVDGNLAPADGGARHAR